MAKATKVIRKSAAGFWSEFKNFAVKGNAFDLAIAVVIGNAFSSIVNSLVADIITPLLGLLTAGGATDFKNLSLTLRASQPPLLLQYGAFLQTILNFFVIALSIFVVFKLISSARKRLFSQGDIAPQHTKPAQERLLEEIRDALKSRPK